MKLDKWADCKSATLRLAIFLEGLVRFVIDVTFYG